MLHRSLKDLLDIKVKREGLDGLEWRDYGNGLQMARLARAGKRELVLYRVSREAGPQAFLRHEHLGGECYLVLQGKITDETGEYSEGEIVFLDPKSVHTPRPVGETLVLVLWPEGVRIVES